ncbi:hypothetical protein CDAR_493421 [Caerostris darwini]|uniref:Uncharacterized protein n=1 Tax=Caerostris darwini TaxID=1538125 RepID=A0AAV4QD36_9ARAC|nr:hypothetical protein CDAR_493421 [Caerostris darwini]
MKNTFYKILRNKFSSHASSQQWHCTFPHPNQSWISIVYELVVVFELAEGVRLWHLDCDVLFTPKPLISFLRVRGNMRSFVILIGVFKTEVIFLLQRQMLYLRSIPDAVKAAIFSLL